LKGLYLKIDINQYVLSKRKISNLRAVTSNGILHTPLLFDPPETFSAAVGSAASDTLKIQSYN
jgi:hypothetical protein